MRTLIVLGLVSLILLGAGGQVWALEELTDAELDRISARGFSFTGNPVTGSFAFLFTRPNTLAQGNGTINLQPLGGQSLNLSSVNLSGNAQQNLRALLNTIAVNSQVQILINLTVNINSSTGPIQQINGGFIGF